MTNDSGNTLLALLTGAAIGAGIGILYAPDKGTKTRKRIKKKAMETTDDLTSRISHAKEELTKTAEAKKIDFEQKLEETISNMSYKADDIIIALEKKLADLKNKNAQLQK
ncbi:YtxH-like protein [Arenibacter algicola]|jgi:gas vesicle protein|uniref:YtxH-like protein n=1 Tax=Arenibacter algicola TaxID=616991 RepID=A0A221UUI5_9FLAO|nr:MULTISPECIES: YtxH domain-containing protein [Arenibacter]ASO04858.1 YtxH-like protein [Arenibacter algicola]GBF18542.1 ytxH-like protein [Arenibacter sp. NBRC 103722]|tara:strand:- start:104 stop:433 length:330 start_codon:yes stop_codon:yes gene_type:complete